MIYFNRCGCVGTVNPPEPPPQPCPEECLSAADIYYTCDEGLAPGDDPFEIDVTEGTDNSAACEGCDLVYNIISFSDVAFDSVVVNSSTGVVTITPQAVAGSIVAGTYYSIVYRISCPCNGTRIEGTIRVCYQTVE